MPEPTIIERTYTRAYSLGVLAVAAVTFPYVVAYCLAAAAYHRLFATTTAPPSNGKTVIITGGKMTKSLHLIRHLKAAGCRVVLCETGKYWMVASRFSSCVDRFVTTPVPDARVKLGAQVVQFLVSKGFVGGDEKWKNVIFVGKWFVIGRAFQFVIFEVQTEAQPQADLDEELHNLLRFR